MDDIKAKLESTKTEYARLKAKYEGSDKAMWPPIKIELERRIAWMEHEILKAA